MGDYLGIATSFTQCLIFGKGSTYQGDLLTSAACDLLNVIRMKIWSIP